MNNKVLVIGDGLLGSEVVKQTGWNYVSRKKDVFDIKDIESFHFLFSGYDVILNAIANTDTYSKERDLHWDVNYKFVHELILFCNKNYIKLVHISTDYLYSGSVSNASENDVPVHCNNWYGYTKLLADGLVQLESNNYLICRCTHKPNPFPYEYAWIDQIGNFDYVNTISSLIIDMINSKISGVYNVGTEIKSMYQLALDTNKDTKAIISPYNVPKNTSMNISKMKESQGPFFSIAIPAYGYNGKGKDFLEHNLNTLKSQTFKEFEVVISDHSTDDTIKDLCDSWRDRLNIKYIRNEIGRGVISPNLNVALKNCSGKWIKILFQDDFLYDNESLVNTYNFILKNKDISWMATSFVHTDDEVNFYRDICPSWNDELYIGNNTIGCPSVISIKNENILLFDESLNWLMDCEYYKRMFDKYGEPSILITFTVVNRNMNDRLTNTISDEIKKAEYLKVRSKYMDKINLPTVTLVLVSSVNTDKCIKAIEYSSRNINFGSVKFLTHEDIKLDYIDVIKIDKLSSIDEYSKFIVYDLYKFIDTEHVLIIQDDGFVLNHFQWRNEFLEYDYIGAPWQLPKDDFSFRDPFGNIIRVGNGGFSLRTKRLLSLPSELNIEWKSYFEFYNEDGFFVCHNRHIFEEKGCVFAPIDIAKYFSHEVEIPETEGIIPFGFHGKNTKYSRLI
jgi:nucleoside-diphosphate-sugar epimerase